MSTFPVYITICQCHGVHDHVIELWGTPRGRDHDPHIGDVTQAHLAALALPLNNQSDTYALLLMWIS